MSPMCSMCAGVWLIRDPGCGGGGMRLWLCARMVAGVVCGSGVFWVRSGLLCRCVWHMVWSRWLCSGSGVGTFSVMVWILLRMLCMCISWACLIEAKWGLVHCVWRWAPFPFVVIVCV